MTTTALDVKKALVTKLRENAPATADENDASEFVPIWYGYERTGTRPREVIWTGEIRWVTEEPRTLGNGRREEIYDIVVTVEVHIPGYTQEQSNDRAEVLIGHIEELVRDFRWSQVPGVQSTNLRPQFLGEGADDSAGRGTVWVTLLRVTASK